MKSCQVVDKTRREKNSACPGQVGGLGFGLLWQSGGIGQQISAFSFFFHLFYSFFPFPPVPARSVSTQPSVLFPHLSSLTSLPFQRVRFRRPPWPVIIAGLLQKQRKKRVVTSVCFPTLRVRPAHPGRLIFSENGGWRNRLTKKQPSERFI